MVDSNNKLTRHLSRYPSGSLVKRQKPLQGENARTPFTGIRIDQTYKKAEVDVKTFKVLTSDGHDWDIVAKLVAEHPHHRPGRGKNLDIIIVSTARGSLRNSAQTPVYSWLASKHLIIFLSQESPSINYTLFFIPHCTIHIRT